MKSRILSVLGVFVLVLLASQINAISAPLVVQANIPFAFCIQGKNLPAGQYTIKRMWDSNVDLLTIRGNDNRSETVFFTEGAQKVVPPRETELVFDKIGNQYFLRGVWTLGESIGRDVPEAKAEKEVRGSAHLMPTQVSVSARS